MFSSKTGRHFVFKEPCLLVSNHPNTLLDPLIPAEFARKQVFFLANAGLFAGTFQNWFLALFIVFRFYRPQDKGYNSGKNKGSFEKAENHLLKDGCLYVAPEGTSYIERRLRPMKTGTARIALQTLERSEFKKDIFILPVGLNYEDQTRFGNPFLSTLVTPYNRRIMLFNTRMIRLLLLKV
ncbi:MAG: 1-acyl-sn-glycerol-3-phosphate acyltransferase [Saprospiraceae bacterium]